MDIVPNKYSSNKVFESLEPNAMWVESVPYFRNESAKCSFDSYYQKNGEIFFQQNFSAREFSELKNYTFLGGPLTGNSKIQSSDDIAYLFKNLEAASQENAFVTLIDKDLNYKVLYLSTGSTYATIIDTKLLVTAALDFNANKICLIHNHPSGSLMASRADIEIHESCRKAMAMFNIEMMPSVIINLDSGKYSTFGEDLCGYANILELDINKQSDAYSPKVFQFDRQILYTPSDQRFKITTSHDVAKYLSKIKRGATPKIGIITLARNNTISRFVLYNESIQKEELIKNTVYDSGRHGDCVICFSNTRVEKEFIEDLKAALSNISIPLIDVITVQPNKKILQNYVSWADDGILSDKKETIKKHSKHKL